MGSTSIDSNFEELLSVFTDRGVRFLVVGGYAVGSHGHPRATKDLDVWVDATPENAARVWRALAEFGMPLEGITPADLAVKGPWLQFGRPPARVDVLTTVEGLRFDDAWARRDVRPLGRVAAPVLCLDDLIRNKRRVGRTQDLADAENLERIRRERAEEGGSVAEKPVRRTPRRSPPRPAKARRRPR